MTPETPQAKQPVIEVPAKEHGIFDHRTHIRDANSGRMVGYQPYARHSFSDQVILERPVGSGNMFAPNGDPIGRWVPDTEVRGAFKKVSDSHGPTAPVPANAQEAMAQENEALKAELAAIQEQLKTRSGSAGTKAN